MNARIKFKISRTRASKLFFISLKAGGVGLNITKASYVLFLDPWWNPLPKSNWPRTSIGQLNKVNVVRFITKNTVEEKSFGYRKTKLLSDALLDENHIS
jgi:non-specific serine/threonine protein kinase